MKFPIHLGVTEAGGERSHQVGAWELGILLADGYGRTIRVSLSERTGLRYRLPAKLLITLFQR